MNHAQQIADREERLANILAGWLEAMESGHAPDEREYLERYPELADSLRQHFDDWKHFPRLPKPALRDTPFPQRDLTPHGNEAGPKADLSATSIGDYEILGKLGRGGMGIVYKARHRRLNRLVALKMLLADGPGFELDLQRLRNEAEVVAALDHPYIIPLYEVGEHEGRVHLSMKLIEGGRLTDVLPRFAEDPRGAARLMVQVARAIHHAHQRGILHRDLKPSSILLDKDGQPFVTDFGLARRLSGDCELTQTGALVGTPGYMAPEQTSGHRKDVTTAADVYGLGAVLYAMLTGKPPFQGQTPLEVLDQVREMEPVPPRHLNPRVNRDLQTICLKCLDKDPQQRYGSVAELADDLQRYLNYEPTLARRPTLAQRARNWGRRHVAAVRAGAAAAFVALIALAAAAGLWARDTAAREVVLEEERDRALRAEHSAQQALAEAQQAKEETAKALKASETARQQAQAVNKYMIDAFRSTSVAKDGRQIKVVDVLDRAVAELEVNFAGPSELKAALLSQFGNTYGSLLLLSKSVELQQKAQRLYQQTLGPDHPDTLANMSDLGWAYIQAGSRKEALPLFEEARKRSTEKLGPDHPVTLNCVHAVARYYKDNGRPAEAVALLEENLRRRRATMGPEHEETLITLNDLAATYLNVKRPADAATLFLEVIERWSVKFGPDHHFTLVAKNNLARAYGQTERSAEAIFVLEEVVKLHKAKFGNDNHGIYVYLNNLALTYGKVGRFAEELPLLEQVAEFYKAKVPDHPDTLRSMNALALGYLHAGRLDAALSLSKETVERGKKIYEPEHPQMLRFLTTLANIYRDAGQLDKALALFEEIIRLSNNKSGPDDLVTLKAMRSAGKVLLMQERFVSAEPILRECLRDSEKKEPEEWTTFSTRLLLGTSLLGQKKSADAEALMLIGHGGMKQREAKMFAFDRVAHTMDLERIVQLHEAAGRQAEATHWRNELHAVKEKVKQFK